MRVLFFVLCLVASISLQAENSLVGDWVTKIPGPDGKEMVIKLSIADGGTYTVDFGNDGTAELKGKYEIKDTHFILWDVEGEGGCNDQKGTYKFTVEGDQVKMDVVEDACENRKGNYVWTKA